MVMPATTVYPLFVFAVSKPGTEVTELNHKFNVRLTSPEPFKSISFKALELVTTCPAVSFWLGSTVIGVDFSIPSVKPLIVPVVETPLSPVIRCLFTVNGITTLFTLSLKV